MDLLIRGEDYRNTGPVATRNAVSRVSIDTHSSTHSYSNSKGQELQEGMEKDEKITHRYMPTILRRYRDLAGLSQQELADSIGVSKGFISALEGGRSVPSIDRLLQIAEALRIRPGVMINAIVEAFEKEES